MVTTVQVLMPAYERSLNRYRELVLLGDERGLTEAEFTEIVNQVGLERGNRDKSGLEWQSKAGRYWPAWWR